LSSHLKTRIPITYFYLGEIDAALRTQAEEFLANAVKAHYVSLPIFDIILSFAKTLLLFSIQTK